MPMAGACGARDNSICPWRAFCSTQYMYAREVSSTSPLLPCR